MPVRIPFSFVHISFFPVRLLSDLCCIPSHVGHSNRSLSVRSAMASLHSHMFPCSRRGSAISSASYLLSVRISPFRRVVHRTTTFSPDFDSILPRPRPPLLICICPSVCGYLPAAASTPGTAPPLPTSPRLACPLLTFFLLAHTPPCSPGSASLMAPPPPASTHRQPHSWHHHWPPTHSGLPPLAASFLASLHHWPPTSGEGEIGEQRG